MKVGFVGLGKLGLPCALAMEHYGRHEIFGYDINPQVKEIIETKKIPYQEAIAQELLEEAKHFNLVDNIFEVVKESDLVFVPIQTPHEPQYEGTQPHIVRDNSDFDYTYLKEGVKQIALAAEWQKKETLVVVISTVLPGTMEQEIKPLLNEYTKLVYNPYFIAMGQTIADFLNPEFILLGNDGDSESSMKVRTFYYDTFKYLKKNPLVFETDIKTAELIKMAYNTFIGMKIVFANTMMEICHKTGADVDDVTRALGYATDRIISSKYLKAGMGDAGGCHPRDQYALSYLSDKLGLRYNLFDDLMRIRDKQNDSLANIIRGEASHSGLGTPIYVLGKAYKPGINLTVGSAAVLLYNELKRFTVYKVYAYDPYVDTVKPMGMNADLNHGVFVIATPHDEFYTWKFSQGSTVIDPWGRMEDQEGVKVIRVGRK